MASTMTSTAFAAAIVVDLYPLTRLIGYVFVDNINQWTTRVDTDDRF